MSGAVCKVPYNLMKLLRLMFEIVAGCCGFLNHCSIVLCCLIHGADPGIDTGQACRLISGCRGNTFNQRRNTTHICRDGANRLIGLGY